MAWTGNGTQSSPWQISDGSSAGNNVTAYRNGSTLYINGSGNMADFWDSLEGEAPWYSERTSIYTVTIQNGVTNIGNRAFHDCSNLQTITTIPSTVTIIGRQAFYNCTNTNFTAITIPNTVHTIEGEAFLNCTSLKTVTIENGYKNLLFIRYQEDGSYFATYHGDWFKNCPIQTLHLGRNYTLETGVGIGTIYYPFSGITTLTTLTIGSLVTTIDSQAFANCNLLKTVTLQDGTENLAFSGSNHFLNAPIETLYLGRNIFTGLVYNMYNNIPFSENTALKTLT
ncbi:MAG: leucine-rich repeat domain-containing protein, partial [Bacteroidales bacterium]|nr:leucine-rich repeat domain-containing protein [Bacteroidales bacterium]